MASFLVPGAVAGAPRGAGSVGGSGGSPSAPRPPGMRPVSEDGAESLSLCLGFPLDVQPSREADSAASNALMRCKLFVMLPY